MYSIGLTGTIASGKSTVANYFRQLGIEVISADDVARQLTQKGSTGLADIVQYFGPKILTETGELNRRQLRETIFNDPNAKLWLEQLLHPLIRKAIADQVKTFQGLYCIIEIPLLLQLESYPNLNRVLLVEADEGTQLSRLMARDHCTEQEARRLLTTQNANNTRSQLANEVIANTGTKAELRAQVRRLHERYTRDL